jgi:hypothetical protein
VQVTSQCRVDAPIDWVRSFLLAGTREDDVTVEGDVIEVRQRDRLIDLVVRNTLSADGVGATVLDVDANLRLLGPARVVGGLFRGRVRRTLERGLDRLPVAIEQALGQQQPEDVDAGDDAYAGGMLDRQDPTHGGAIDMTDEHPHGAGEHDVDATTVSGASKDHDLEADQRTPTGPRETLEKAATEAGAGDGVVDSAKRVGRELDRTFGGEYEAREDQEATREAEDGTAG